MNFYCIYVILSVDPSLGKVDKASFSQQTLMELLIEGITNRSVICGSTDSPQDISEWEEVECNESNEVVNIIWFAQSLQGSIQLQWLPPSSQSVSFASNELSGTVDLTCLPNGLMYLSLMSNRFFGTVDLTHLPPKIWKLFLHMNRFIGKTDFSQLPQSLMGLTVSDTLLEGEVFHFDGKLIVDNSNVKDMRKK